MISIVVYGRNDQHGYNLHKRAAISLNCLGQVLGDPEDELIFVDYNTPDDLPTFPEAIADTLTAHTRSILRILRVRPRFHQRFLDKTNLSVLEAVARNIGVRRSRAANRWVLSTNTDIIPLLRHSLNLSDALRDLPSGFYHTARFEIPESLWESFDRADPKRNMEEVRVLGRSARLNEIVYGSDAILYDGPGDFQLVERADLFEIGGFDEKMLHSWHVDSNLAKRLSLKRGPVSSLIDKVYCYHCDHTRQATPAHSGNNPVNDPGRFVDGLTRPDLPEQRERWGYPDEAFEEIRLGQAALNLYRNMVDSVVAPLAQDFTESRYVPDTYDLYHYDPEHVLPFLANMLNCYPRETRLAWCGSRRDMFELVRRAWRGLGFVKPIAVYAGVAPYLRPQPGGDVEITGRGAWLADADLFAFEFGRVGDSGAPADPTHAEIVSGADTEALGVVHSAFLAAVAAEHSRLSADPAQAPRCFIGVNCIHNRSEGIFAAHIAATLTPFGSHLRHGFLAGAAREAEPETGTRLVIGRALGRGGPISTKEFAFARDLFAPLLQGEPLAATAVHRAAAHAALGQAFLAAVGNPGSMSPVPEPVERALAALAMVRPSTTLAAGLGVPIIDGPAAPAAELPLSRFAAVEDWDDPSWSAFTLPFVTDPEANAVHRRDTARWEQVQLLYGLDRAGVLLESSRVLVVATMPDATIAAISQRAGNVEVFGLAADGPADEREARIFWSDRAAYDPATLTILGEGCRVEHLEQQAYDAVVFPHGAMFGAGLESALAWMRAAEGLLRTSGVLAFKAEIAAGTRPHPSFFDVRAVTKGGLAAQLAASTRFVVEGGFDARLSRATIDRIAPAGGSNAMATHFLSRQDGRVLIPAVWFLTRRDRDREPHWDNLRRWGLLRRFGEEIAELRVGAAGFRDDDGGIGTLPERQGHVFFGPYLEAPYGGYRAAVRIKRSAGKGRARLSGAVVEAVVDGTVLAAKHLPRIGPKPRVLTLDFEVRRNAEAATAPVIEIRAYSPGGLAITFTSADLQLDRFVGMTAWPELPASSARSGAGPALAPPVAEQRADGNGRSGQPSELGFPTVREIAAGARPISRIIAYEDWDDAAWSRFIDPHASAPTAAIEPRDPGVWERTHLLYGLEQSGELIASARVLVAATMPDTAIAMLSECVGRVEVLDLRRDSDRSAAEARLYWSDGALYARDRLVAHERSVGFGSLEEAAYDAVVFPHGSLFCGGVAGMAWLLAKAERLLTPGGVVAFKAELLAGDEPDIDHPDASFIREDGLIAQIEAATGFAVEGGFDARLSRRTAERGPMGEHASSGQKPLLSQHRGRVAVPSLWFLQKRGQTPDGGWERVSHWLLDRLLGEQIRRLEVGPAGRRDGPGRIATKGVDKGHVFFGPYLALPSGRYEAAIGIEAPAKPQRARLAFDVLATSGRLHYQDVRLGRGASTTVRLRFAVPPASGDEFEKIEIRAWSGGADAVFTECRLNQLDG